jgi:ribose-phosphate pyrophosphokinase
MNTIVFSLPGNEKTAKALAKNLGGESGRVVLRRFPDGESYVCVESNVAGKTAIVVATMREPDDKILQLIFLAAALEDLGAKKIILVAPYLAYMRQDRRFRAGEGVTSVYFARLISEWFDALVTVDPHLHRRSSLDEIYAIPSAVLHAAPLISNWIRENVENPLLVGPDAESEQWVKAVSERAGAPHVVLEKIRRGDRDVEISIPHLEKWRGRTPVLVDDIVSTARTMIETVRHLKNAGMPAPVCVGVHAVFAGNAYRDLLAAGAGGVHTSDTIPHASNAISVAPLLTKGVLYLLESGKLETGSKKTAKMPK